MTAPSRPARQQVHQDDVESVKSMFAPGGVAHGKDFFVEDWFLYFPDGTYEVHETCRGCESNGTCPFHPRGCDCSYGACQGGYSRRKTETGTYKHVTMERASNERPIVRLFDAFTYKVYRKGEYIANVKYPLDAARLVSLVANPDDACDLVEVRLTDEIILWTEGVDGRAATDFVAAAGLIGRRVLDAYDRVKPHLEHFKDKKEGA